MSFSFSQKLLNDIPDSQGSHSDSSQPLTQPMMGYYTTNHSSQPKTAMAIPRPPSFPKVSRQSGGTAHYRSTDQLRANYSRVESNCTNQVALGDILRDIQTRINSIASSSSRMLEEALVFLEDNVKKEKTETLAGIKFIEENVQTLKDDLLVHNEETDIKTKNLMKPCLSIAQSLKKMLYTVSEDREDATKVLDSLEKSVQAQALLSQNVLEKLTYAANALDSMEETIFIKKAEMSIDHRKGSSGEPMSTRRKYECTFTAPSFDKERAVRNFSCVNRQVKPIIDFSSVMEVDSDSDDEWDE